MDAAATVGDGPMVIRTDDAGMTTLTLNRPRQFNALSAGMLDALAASLEAVANDDAVRVVVIAAAGKAFCPGHDLKEMLANREEPFIGRLFERCCEVMTRITSLPQPVIARVHGIATAAGCQLVASCDLAVASTEARFATSGINLGLFCFTPGVAVSRNLAQKHAFEMLATGNFIDAPTALAWGLLNRVTEPGTLDDGVRELARPLLEKPPAVLAAGKRFFHAQRGMGLADAYRLASREITANMMGAAALEGVTAFIEKRAPAWKR
jgi:enoyl-CoA hydratase/carnithine racemase